MPNDSGSAPIHDAAVHAAALTRQFGNLTAVDQVTLTIDQGEIFGLIGPNGAGKSTLIKMLTTLLPPTSGSATIAGCDVVTQPADVRRHIGYVPQLLSADGSLTGYENMLCPPVSTAFRVASGPNASPALSRAWDFRNRPITSSDIIPAA